MENEKELIINRISSISKAIDGMTYEEWHEVRKSINAVYHRYEYEAKRNILLTADDVKAIAEDLHTKLLVE